MNASWNVVTDFEAGQKQRKKESKKLEWDYNKTNNKHNNKWEEVRGVFFVNNQETIFKQKAEENNWRTQGDTNNPIN